MKVIAEGCPYCEPLVDPQGEREGEHHIAVRFPETVWGSDFQCEVYLDGKQALDVTEAWAGSPGRVIRVEPVGLPSARPGSNVQICFHKTGECSDNHSGHSTYKRWLIEYAHVEIRRVGYPLALGA